MTAVTLKEKAYAELRKSILNGELKPGDFLTERMLVEQLEMSRTPIRAALERLDAEGLAKYTPNKGLVVTDISISQASDIYDFRMAMECFVAGRLALRRWSPEDIGWFRSNLRLQEKCVQEDDHPGFTEADALFHRKLAEVYENNEILQTMDRLQDKLYQIALRVLKKDRTRIRQSFQDHMEIFEHILQGKQNEAAKAMETHLEYGKKILIT
ncbi:GntR family transcriptional regulator [Paenibacillus gansuensis]|uniref:GntR family transcriptional regulator n=1 Tax=Paenibacillus gansuensis TaxID=306542 RepID=A0ABW5PCS8_9BACL